MPCAEVSNRLEARQGGWPGSVIALLAAYSALLLPLLPLTPLWVDELLQLFGTRDRSLGDLFAWIPLNAGAVPLGYLVQLLLLKIVGFSTFTARLPAAICSVLAAMVVLLLARRLRLRPPLLAVLLLVALPAQFRYATEARPNSQALLLSVLSSLLVLALREKPGVPRCGAYSVCVLAGLYTQPFTFCASVAHLVWAALFLPAPERRRLMRYLVWANAGAVALFLPWFLAVAPTWRWSIVANRQSFQVSKKFGLLLLREFSGGGYVCSIGLLLAAALGALSDRMGRETKIFLLLTVLTPLPAVLLADAAFDYFFASRQLLVILPGLVLLAAEGVGYLWERRRIWLAGSLLTLVLASSVAADVRRFTRPREDWRAAAQALRGAANSGYCIAVVGDNPLAFYAFFEPSLRNETCQQSGSRPMAVVVPPYSEPKLETQLIREIEQRSFLARQTLT